MLGQRQGLIFRHPRDRRHLLSGHPRQGCRCTGAAERAGRRADIPAALLGADRGGTISRIAGANDWSGPRARSRRGRGRQGTLFGSGHFRWTGRISCVRPHAVQAFGSPDRPRCEHATESRRAFWRVVDYGLENNALGVKITFRLGSTPFAADQRDTGPYDTRIKQIAEHSARKNACPRVTGHSSPSGSGAINDQLSQPRVEYVKGGLGTSAPGLRGHVIAAGVGAENNLLGTGAADVTDSLDRRVVFQTIPACQ